MTILEKFSDRPFAMMQLHKNWCDKQSQPPFCLYDSGRITQKMDWPSCPNRSLCFNAFIHSDYEKFKPMNIDKHDSVSEIIAKIRNQIECAEADAEELEIECVFTAEEVKDLLKEIESAFKEKDSAKKPSVVQGELFEDTLKDRLDTIVKSASAMLKVNRLIHSDERDAYVKTQLDNALTTILDIAEGRS